MGQALQKCIAFTAAYQGLGFAVAATLQTEKFYDLLGGSNFVLNAAIALRCNDEEPTTRQWVAAGSVAAWGIRLSSFLFQRILHDGRDKRFDRVRNNPRLFFVFWFVQALWVLFTQLPVLILLGKKRREQPKKTKTREYVGWGLWALGMAMEIQADRQKSVFRANPANAGQFITGGLWDISRHPNYFGEMTLWAGLWLAASASFARPMEHLSVASPLFVVYLIARVSGIPMLEKASDKKWGGLEAYETYKRATPVLVPGLHLPRWW